MRPPALPLSALAVVIALLVGCPARRAAPPEPMVSGLLDSDGRGIAGALAAGMGPRLRWRPAADLPLPRANAEGVLLPDGSVLLAGGNDAYQWAPPCLRYDPDTDAWLPAGSLTVPRFHHQLVALPDGRALVSGGVGAAQASLASAERWSPDSNRWTAAAAMAWPREFHTLTALPDGRVLASGGFAVGGHDEGIWRSAELYDPHTDSWTATTPLSTRRASHTATLLDDGRVLVVGGRGGAVGEERVLATAELFDPVAGTWSPAAPPGHARAGHAAALLGDGTVVVISGEDADGDVVAEGEVYDPAADAWRELRPVEHPTRAAELARYGVAPLARALVLGGVLSVDGQELELTRAAHIGPGQTSWSPVFPSSHTARSGHVLVGLADGRVLAVGGAAGGRVLADVEVLTVVDRR